MSRFNLAGWQLREIKSEPLTRTEIEELYRLAGSYEALFSKRSTQIKLRGLNVKELSEDDFKQLLIYHYTFLQRPVFLTEDRIFIGNSKKNLQHLDDYFQKEK